ncbi:MAG: porin family protein [Chitinophagaceae bacterium]
MIKIFIGFIKLLLPALKIGCVFILLEGCYCEQRCRLKQNPTGNFFIASTRHSSTDSNYDCFEYCSLINIDPDRWAVDPFVQKNKSTSINPTSDSVVSISNTNTLPKKKSPGHTIPGEYFATTITGGPAMNFKSSNDAYGGGYGKHKPGIGFHFALGTLLPFTPRWALATSLRFTQKNASEEIGYTEPGGGGGSTEYKDNYSYNYLGAAVMAQYRLSRQLSLAAGLEVNYLLSASVKNGGRSGSGEKQNLNESSQKVGVDVIAGVKYEIPSNRGRSKWGLNLFYDHRISRLNKKEDNGFPVPAYRMKSVHLGLNYFICGKCGKPKKMD